MTALQNIVMLVSFEGNMAGAGLMVVLSCDLFFFSTLGVSDGWCCE